MNINNSHPSTEIVSRLRTSFFDLLDNTQANILSILHNQILPSLYDLAFATANHYHPDNINNPIISFENPL
jgi:hypothetical protein